MSRDQRLMRRPVSKHRIGRTATRIVLTVSIAFGWPFTSASQSHLVSAQDTRSFAQCTNGQRASGNYRLSGWKVAAPTTAHLNQRSVPANLRGVSRRVMQASFDAWRVELSVPRITVAADGSLVRPAANRRYDLMFGPLPAKTIATAYTWQWSDGFVESDVVFNSRLRWFAASGEGDGCYESIAKFELGNIATHEFGHVYGLGHPRGNRHETMYRYGYTGETLRRSPAKGDVTGIRALY